MGIVIACVCVCVYLCVCQFLLVRAITHHMFQLESSDLDKKMQNILLKVPIVLGADWAWPSMSNLTSFQNSVYLHRCCVFEIFVRCAKMGFVELFHITHDAAHILIALYACQEGRAMYVKQSNNKSLWDHQSPARLRLGDCQWILQAAVGFPQIIGTWHTDILYYNIDNHQNNCKTAFICLYLFGSHTLQSALFLAGLSTHASPSLFHILTSFMRTSPITMLNNRPCHGPWRGLGDSTL